jgi:hypothetical protein
MAAGIYKRCKRARGYDWMTKDEKAMLLFHPLSLFGVDERTVLCENRNIVSNVGKIA